MSTPSRLMLCGAAFYLSLMTWPIMIYLLYIHPKFEAHWAEAGEPLSALARATFWISKWLSGRLSDSASLPGWYLIAGPLLAITVASGIAYHKARRQPGHGSMADRTASIAGVDSSA